MRGKSGGLETLLRKKNKNVLDIHGDTVHIASHTAKDFCRPFDNFIEDLASDLFYDFKLSPKATALLTEACELLHVRGVKVTSPSRHGESVFDVLLLFDCFQFVFTGVVWVNDS